MKKKNSKKIIVKDVKEVKEVSNIKIKEPKKFNVNEMLKEGGVLVRVIVELQGGPKEHIVKTMELLISAVKIDYNVVNTIPNDVIELEGNKGIFSIFCEFEMAFENNSKLIDFCFDFTPTSVEIIEPEQSILKAQELTNLLNDVVNHLHKGGEIVKQVSAQNKILQYNASAFLRNLLIVTLAIKDRDLVELSKITGVKEPDLDNILKQLVERKELQIKDKKYSLVKQ
ncbi:MAG: hypothetical protein WC755_04045 [Candidatus Woesearchaeota archaeon]|jgi:hypothetical protein